MNFLNDNFISEALVFVFKWLGQFINDYGLLIILLTLLIKLVTLPLDIKQRSSSRQMTLISDEVKNIQKRYANNPDQANRKVQELYKEKNVKPMAGCWPMLVTMVLLFAFYGALRVLATEQTVSIFLRAVENGAETIELPRFLWVRNIFQADSGTVSALPTAESFLSFIQQNANYITPSALKSMVDGGILSFSNGTMVIGSEFETIRSAILTANGCMQNGVEVYNNGWFILPLLSAATLFFQSWISTKLGGNNAANAEAAQTNKMMMWMFPLMSFFICLSSNSIFSLYWVFSSLYSIALTVITSMVYKKQDKNIKITAENFRK